MSLPRVGIIGTGFFGTALKNSWLPLVGTQIFHLDVWEKIEERPEHDPEILVLAIPSTAKNGEKLAILDYIEKFPLSQIVVTSKGRKALKIFQKHISPADQHRVFSLSGPNLANQLTHTPTATKLAGHCAESAASIALTLNGALLNVEPAPALEVVQRGGMLKNFLVYELGKIWHTLTTKEAQLEATIHALETGFSSITLQVPPEEDKGEFFDISGLGDILLCLGIFCETRGSRNFRAGRMMAQGSNHEEILEEFKTLEGLQVSIQFHSEFPPEFLRCDMMNSFRELINHPATLVVTPIDDNELRHLANELWQKYQPIIREKKFQSNTHAWVICEILLELSARFSIQLNTFESAEPLLRAILAAVLSPQKSERLSPRGEKIWLTISNKLPFLK